jgi:hypothetical protein
VTLSSEELEDEARRQTGLEDFGDGLHREGLERLVDSMSHEADLSESGEMVLRVRLVNLLTSRLRVEDTYRAHPSIEAEEVEGPVFVIGLPRTGTTALSQLVAADPQFRSVRLWESSSPCPPPEKTTELSDPRIAQTGAGLEMMYQMFPLMRTMHHEEANSPTECQDLLGMSFRTVHFEGMARVPSYLGWVTDCDMRETYRYHRRVLRLLQWHCPPRLWHLKTPVHMFALDALLESYPNARFLWSHRDPAEVLGSVCSLIHYVRSWASDRNDALELGGEQLELWWEAVSRAMDFRARMGDERFADLAFSDLQDDPVDALGRAYERIGLPFGDGSRQAVGRWAGQHEPGKQGTHSYDLADFGLDPERVRARFTPYLEAFGGIG